MQDIDDLAREASAGDPPRSAPEYYGYPGDFGLPPEGDAPVEAAREGRYDPGPGPRQEDLACFAGPAEAGSLPAHPVAYTLA